MNAEQQRLTLDFTDDTGHQLSFGRTVQKFNQSAPSYPALLDGESTWKVVGRTVWDKHTPAEISPTRPSTTTSVQSYDVIAAHTGPVSPVHRNRLEDQPTTSYNRDDDDNVHLESYVVSPSDPRCEISEPYPINPYIRPGRVVVGVGRRAASTRVDSGCCSCCFWLIVIMLCGLIRGFSVGY